MSAQRGQVVVGSNSWHYRVYQWFTDKHPNAWDYQENLCHYVRIVAIYAPIVWLVTKPLYRYVGAPIVKGVMVVIAVFTFLLEERTKRRRIFLIATFPIWGAFAAILVATFVIMKALEIGLSWFIWYRLGFWVARPWTVTLLVLVLLSPILFGWEPVLEWLKFGATVVLIVGLLAGALYVLFLLGKGLYEQLPERIVVVKKPPSTSTLRILWEYLVALKHRICPFIILPNHMEVQTA